MTLINNERPREIAAIDMGSNSFHMVVARVVGQSLQIISRHKQRVHLASGLDSQQNLDQAAIQRGLNCLTMFAERLQGFAPENVRIAATYTLRQARNAHVFLKRAESIIPYPIEIIPGTEEARLIYLGVAHTQPDTGRKLIVDTITTRQQRELLDELKSWVGAGSLIPPESLYSTQLGRYQQACIKMGIDRAHGLRHAYAQKRYLELVGFPCPAKGGPKRGELPSKLYERVKEIRTQISEELGHGREEVTAVYLGR
jgi:hypothetical protein